jgi:hypothetical protein
LIAGQDKLFFVPLTPSSLASLAVPKSVFIVGAGITEAACGW